MKSFLRKLLRWRRLPAVLLLLATLVMGRTLYDRVKPIVVQDVGYCTFVSYELGDEADYVTVQFNNLEPEWPSAEPVTLRITGKKARALFADLYLPSIEGVWVRATISHGELWALGYYPAGSDLVTTLLTSEEPAVWDRYLTATGIRGG